MRLFVQSFYSGVDYDGAGNPVASYLVVLTDGQTTVPVEIDEETYDGLTQMAMQADQIADVEVPPDVGLQPAYDGGHEIEVNADPQGAQVFVPGGDLQHPNGGYERTVPAPPDESDFGSPPQQVIHEPGDVGELNSPFQATEDGDQL